MKKIGLFICILPLFAMAQTAQKDDFVPLPDPEETPVKEAAIESEEKSKNPIGKTISGVVRLIRANPETEVFFKDGKESVFISQGSKHNLFYEACNQSMKTKTPISVVVDPISRKVLNLPSAAKDPTSATPPSTSSPSSSQSNSGSQ